jgi:phosphoserine phosphatase RsbU/P
VNGEAGGATPRVLVVDDSSFNRLLLRKRLEELGYTDVAVAENGVQALAAMDATPFDAVLLDLEMPELDGIGVLERMRQSGRHEPPVIVISAISDLAGVVRCIELGAEDYLPKSFEPPLLRARLASVLEKKRLRGLAQRRLEAFEAELDSARRAQLSLVPHDFAAIIAGRIGLHAVMVPARQVGGDLYDALRLDADGRRLLFAVGDVSGKGAPAALTMARTMGLLRATARAAAAASPGLPDPALLLAMVNDELAAENESLTFVTAALGVLDTTTGEGVLALAGHDPPLLLSPGRAPVLLTPEAFRPALGMREGIAYQNQPLRLGPGETLLVYTDGVTEAEDAAAQFYGRERLLELLAGPAGGAEPRGLVGAVMDDLERFVRGAEQTDDITALAVRFG